MWGAHVASQSPLKLIHIILEQLAGYLKHLRHNNIKRAPKGSCICLIWKNELIVPDHISSIQLLLWMLDLTAFRPKSPIYATEAPGFIRGEEVALFLSW